MPKLQIAKNFVVRHNTIGDHLHKIDKLYDFGHDLQNG